MTKKRHSTVQFEPDVWLASTARMPRLVRSVLFDLCVYNWQRAQAVPPSEVFLMISDLPDGQGEAIIENLVAGEHLVRAPDGAVYSPLALEQAERAYAVWEAKSRGGRGGGAPAPVEEPEAPEEPYEPMVPEPDFVPPEAPAEPDRRAPSEEDMTKAIAAANDLQSVAEAWNAMAARSGLKQIKRMTAERQGRLNARLAEHGAQAIVNAILHMAGNEMVLSTKPTFDSILNPETCAKMIGNAACGQPVE